MAEVKLEDGECRSNLMRAQWLRAAILGANDGLLSTTSLMLGVGTAKEDRSLMILSGVAGAVAGACSMAVGEFVSVSTQRDIEDTNMNKLSVECEDVKIQESIKHPLLPGLPNPYKAAGASALAFLCGSLVPIVSALVFSRHGIRYIAMVVVTSLALLLFGGVGARLGGSPVRISALRVLVGGWISMALTYGLLMLLDKDRH
ncbi:hypothetical protein SASPL_137957 [Salvia splendens]|uniref:Vacuolar iron transporter n=1 Tax=Salvia splendens TaxID=180675 RepID=A0A8X8ZDF6_SALSN|nr:vacuolar iron transporter homolog 2-like [Salvia splendens]KAG6401112.1 hypothetical protein SASPL_137957 [Salvia splendens]